MKYNFIPAIVVFASYTRGQGAKNRKNFFGLAKTLYTAKQVDPIIQQSEWPG